MHILVLFNKINLKFNSNTKHDISKIIDFMDSVCEKIIQPELDNIFKQIYNNLNGYENSISMKREALCNKGIWIKKKNYISLFELRLMVSSTLSEASDEFRLQQFNT